jgi:RNA polymerase sigma-70 factor, ECF subfamily
MNGNLISKVFQENEKKYRNFALSLCEHDKNNADDLIQETLLRLLLAKDKYSEADVTKMFMTCIYNAFINKYRREFNKDQFYEEMLSGEQEIDCTPLLMDEQTTEKHLSIDLKEIMKFDFIINKHFRDIAKAHFIDGLTDKDIGIFYDIPNGTVKSRLHRLKKIIANNELVKDLSYD